MVWNGVETDFVLFSNEINKLIPRISIEFSIAVDKINFLDLTLYKNQNNLHHHTYFKPTNYFQYLHPKSHHPMHIYKGIAKS